MALDLLPSFRSTAVVALVAVAFSSPIVAKSDAFAGASARLTGGEPPTEGQLEQLVAGEVEFAMPEAWGRLASPAPDEAGGDERIGTVVTQVCPGGRVGSECADAALLTFVAYSGKRGHELPLLSRFEAQLDAQLAKEFPGYRAGDAATHPTADGARYLDYSFTWGKGAARSDQRIAAYRHDDGSGVVVMASGAKLPGYQKQVDRFLAGARLLDHH